MFAEIGIVFVLLLVNGFFAMSELAVVSARKAWLKGLAEDTKNTSAQMALHLAEDPSTFLAFIQIGITLISVFAGAFSGATLGQRLGERLDLVAWLAPYAHTVAMIITVSGVTYFNLVIGELVPKRIGLVHAELIAVRVAPFVHFCVTMTLPLVWLLKGSGDLMLKILRVDENQSTPVTEDEVKDLIAEGTQAGLFKPAERNMLESVMRLSDRTVRSIMTPRIDMIWLGAEDTVQEHMQTIRSSGYSRFPVARGDMEEVMGVVHAKDILNQITDGQTADLTRIMRPPLRVPDTAPVFRLLEQFKQSRQHLAIVIDEYGSVEGLVSLRDILEAITGELPEMGQESDEKPVQREDGSWLLDGMMPVEDVEDLLGFKNMRDGEEFHTLAGFVIDQLGHMPAVGDHFVWSDAVFEVVDMDARRVDRVLVVLPGQRVLNVVDES